MTSRKLQSVPSAPKRSVLIVDDDVAATDSLTDILTGEGCTVSTAKNGKEALEHLQR